MSSRATQQFEADGQQSRTAAVSEEAEVADANEGTRKQMQQETAQELVCRQAHQLLLVAVCGVTPAKGDVAVFQCDEPAVRDRHTMGVGAEIA